MHFCVCVVFAQQLVLIKCDISINWLSDLSSSPSPSPFIMMMIINGNGIWSRAVLRIQLPSPFPSLPSALGVNMINGSSSASQPCFASFSIIVFVFLLNLPFPTSLLSSPLSTHLFCFIAFLYLSLSMNGADHRWSHGKRACEYEYEYVYEYVCECECECECFNCRETNSI